jgi:hypothetical protein
MVVASDSETANDTITDIRLNTPRELATELLVIDELGAGLQVPARVFSSTGQSRYELINTAAALAREDHLAVVIAPAKLKPGWLEYLLELVQDDDHTLVGPKLSGMDHNLWSFTDEGFDSVAFDWGLRLHNSIDGPILHDGPFVVNRHRFLRLGGFDTHLSSGQMAELCIRTWLCGGRVRVDSRSRVAFQCRQQFIDSDYGARIAEVWMGAAARRFYASRGIGPTAETSKHADAHRVQQSLQEHQFGWLVEQFMPELGKIHELQGVARGKTVAIVCDGPSLDYVGRWEVSRHDIIIGLDYTAALFPCDYVVCINREAIRTILATGRYDQQYFLLPKFLHDGMTAMPARDLVPGASVYQTVESSSAGQLLEPPFANYGHPMHLALQLAAFMGSTQVTLYGWDGRLVEGRSHTGLVAHYKSGYYLPNNQHTAELLSNQSRGLEVLVRMLYHHGVTVMKHSFA